MQQPTVDGMQRRSHHFVTYGHEDGSALENNIQVCSVLSTRNDWNSQMHNNIAAKVPFDIEFDEEELPFDLQISLENKGIYGWWATNSPSPSPGPISFGISRRRLTRNTERVGDFVAENENINSQENSHNHGLLDRSPPEEKKWGDSSTCSTPGDSETSFSAYIWELHKPMILLTKLFVIAANLGQEEMLATSSDVRRVLAHSKLAWVVFNFCPRNKLLQKSKFADDSPFIPATYQSRSVTTNPLETISRTVDQLTQIGLSCIKTIQWIREIVQPIVSHTHPGANTENSTMPMRTSTGDSTRRTGFNSEILHQDHNKAMSFGVFLQSGVERLQELFQWFNGDDSIWVNQTTDLDEESIKKLKRIMEDIRRWEVTTLKKTINKRSHIVMTLFEFITLLCPHLGPNVIRESLRNQLVERLEQEREAKSSLMKLKINKSMPTYALRGLLGYPLGTTEKGVDVAAIALEPPHASIADLLDPFELQLNDRYCDLMAHLDANGALPPNAYDACDTVENDTMWLPETNTNKKKNLRDHLQETLIEQQSLTKKLNDHLLAERYNNASNHYDSRHSLLPTIDKVQNDRVCKMLISREFTPKRRNRNLYGELPKHPSTALIRSNKKALPHEGASYRSLEHNSSRGDQTDLSRNSSDSRTASQSRHSVLDERSNPDYNDLINSSPNPSRNTSMSETPEYPVPRSDSFVSQWTSRSRSMLWSNSSAFLSQLSNSNVDSMGSSSGSSSSSYAQKYPTRYSSFSAYSSAGTMR